MDDRITVSVLSRAADLIAETNRGLSGTKIISYCNAFAIDHDVCIPHAAYPFQAANKRTALFENLRAFSPRIQYRIIIELCEDSQFRENEDVKAISLLVQERYSHLADAVVSKAPPWATNAATSATLIPKAAPVANTSSNAPSSDPIKPYDIFLSYSHADEALMTLVREHLVLYDRLGKIRKWWDRKLLPGEPIDNGITHYLSSSEIILLFVSASFLASDYCYDVEMTQALQQHAQGRSVVVPVILRDCCWQDAPFGRLLALPTDGRPLVSWSDRDAAAKNIADGVMRVVAELQTKKQNVAKKA